LLFVRHANSLITLFKPGHNLSSYQYEPPAWDFAQKLLAISLFNKTVTWQQRCSSLDIRMSAWII